MSNANPPPAPPKKHGGVWTAIRIFEVRIRFILLFALLWLVLGHWDWIMAQYDRHTRPANAPSVAGESNAVEYTCPMHPQVEMSEPGNCPICGMPLVAKAKGTGKVTLPPGVLGQVQLTPQKMMMGRIGTSPVEYRLLSREARTVGVIGYDETKRRTISARIKGRLDKLMVNYVGQKVDKGDPLALIYSPDLVVAQEELLTAARSVESAKGAGGALLSAAQAVLDAACGKLLLWGFTEQQVDEVIASRKPQTHMTIYAPISGFVTEKKALEGRYVNEGDDLYTLADLSTVWMQARIFPGDLGSLRDGNSSAVEVHTTAYPNETFPGRIQFVAYTVDAATQTVEARVEIKNSDYRLRIGMEVGAVIHQPAGRVEAVSPGSRVASSGPAFAAAGAATEPLAQAYLALVSAYAEDRADANALAALAKEAELLAAKFPQAADIARLARQMGPQDLRGQRTALPQFSRAVIALLKSAPPAGMGLYLMHCPMDRGGDWLSLTKEIRNPYYGSEMLTCGDPPVRLEPPSAARALRYAEGYYCPLHPDQLYGAQQQCPVDAGETKYVRIEKLLAVPASAVMDTGAQRIVYRQSSPGVFDKLPVKLGVIAGEYYPVVEGLKEGDQVATAGAFLVDAEDRLNPAVSTQFVGATSGGAPAAPAPAEHRH